VFGDMSITTRFSIVTALLIVVLVATTSLFTITRMQSTLDTAERQQLEQTYRTLLADLDAEGRRAASLSALVAGQRPVQRAFAAGDRQQLLELFAPVFAELKRDHGVRQFHFHTPPATSFLRLHKPEQFGDDMSSERLMVLELNRGLKPLHGLETGVGGLGVRGIVPVRSGNQHVGSVEFGVAFDHGFFEHFKQAHGVDLMLRIAKGGGFETFGSTVGKEALLDEAQEKAAFHGDAVQLQKELGDRPVAVYANAVKDFSGRPIGVLTIAADRSFYADALASVRNAVLGIGSVAFALGIFFSILLARSICRPLHRVAASLEDIGAGEGDLTRRLPETGSAEIARLGRGFNRFVTRIQQTVEEVANGAGKLADTVGDLSSAAEHTHRGMQQQQAETGQIATAMNEMSTTVHEVAKNTARAAGAAGEADKQARSGRAVVESSINSIQELAQEVERVAQVISRVDEESTNIGAVLDVIGSIAEQTNLLALNAAIEAARAGEQGRGFAVVADEVRVLAHRTQKSTGEIREMIERLQGSAKEAVQAMGSSRERTRQSVEHATGAGAALTDIAKSVDVISEMNGQIATASEEQSAVADEINRNIVRINDVAEVAVQESAQTAGHSEQLVRLAENLLKLVHEFKLGDRDLVHDLDRAKTAHLAWRVRLRSFLDGRESLTAAQVVSDHECAFGKWYFADGMQNFGGLPEMQQVRAPHAEMHRLIRHIIELKNAGHSADAETEYAKVEPLSREIVGLIDRIRQHVEQNLRSAA